jgi:hypothetical protein
MDPLGPRRYTRTVLRGYVAELHRLGILDAACARAPPEILPLLENPGRAPSWLGPEAIDEVLKAVDTLRGREAVRELGYHLVKHRGLASVLEPFVHLSLILTGGSPGSLFSRLPVMASLGSRGLEVKWASTGPASGTIHIRCDGPVQDLVWAAWEGMFTYVLELGRRQGTVARARVAPDEKSCEVDVSWEPKAK